MHAIAETKTRNQTDHRKRWKRRFVLVGLVIAIYAAFIAIRHSSNTIMLGSTWEENGLYPIEQFDHRPFTQLLTRYVDENGKVDYARWHQNFDDRLELLNYLQSTSRIHWNTDGTPHTIVPKSRDHEKAFWINAYNALTIHAILQVYPTNSVRQHINPIGYNLWNHCKLLVGARAYSLSEIESGPLKELGDPRIQFAIVKASASCPNLDQNAYLPADIHERLNLCAKTFLASEKNLRVEGIDRIHLSPILKPLLEGPGVSGQQQLDHLAEMVMDAQIRHNIETNSPKITWMKHDWSLNSQ